MVAEPRDGCAGVVPLTGRLEPWQRALAATPDQITSVLEEHGSPVNLLDTGPMSRNLAELAAPAAERGIELKVYFARKANKALCFVDEAHRLDVGIDVASENELRQVLERGVDPAAIIVTAAVKPAALLRLCTEAGVTVAIDNEDELDLLASLLPEEGRTEIAIRLAPRDSATRFGIGADQILAIAAGARLQRLSLTGLHFHLDGYSADDRVAAIGEALRLIDDLSGLGHHPSFLDIGGGVPMSYLDSAEEWGSFWAEHERSLLGRRDRLTFEGHGLGLRVDDGRVSGTPAVYPFHQRPTRGDWLATVLDSRLDRAGPGTGEESVAQALSDRCLQLRCEPGRSLLDGCGMTAARVEFRKRRGDGTWLIGLAMNRTQCRSTSEDFLVDPLLIRPTDAGGPTEPIEGYLVGAYCIERELLSWRRMQFPRGVAVGDIVCFVNTAGYLMHILESASHQIPLARNLVMSATGPNPDPIDQRRRCC